MLQLRETIVRKPYCNIERAILREQTAIENCERDLGFSLENLLSVNS